MENLLSKEECKTITLEQTTNMREIDNSYIMIGTTAYHQMGDLSREDLTVKDDKSFGENLFWASKETDDYWIGSWITGYGFFNVCYPKKDSRGLTDKELEKAKKLRFQLSDQPIITIGDAETIKE